ncbi:MAG: DnaD domain protein [Bacilli bacterium]
MKSGKLLDLLKDGYFVVPLYLFKLKDKFDLTMEEFIFLVYLSNKGDKVSFDPSRITKDLGMELSFVMEYVSKLCDKHLIEVIVSKNDKGVMEEVISLELYYSKITGLLMDNIVKEDKTLDSNIYSIFEQEFGRTLSPMEYEIIKAWTDSNISRELILRALKEASYNGVSNLRYIDKILYEWGKKGFKTEADVDKHQVKRREEKKDKPKTEIFDYNWFDDEDE